MSDPAPEPKALDDTADGDEFAGDPVAPKHDLDVDSFEEEPSDD